MVVLWNHERCSVQATFSIQSSDQPQEVESLSWHADGTKFISAHGDGSLTRWSLEGSLEIPKAVTPLGPFPCKAITKVEWSDSSVFFSGGMPRASYGDRHCVSLIQDANLVEGGDNTPQVAFDFTSRVMDFFTVKANGAGKLKKKKLFCIFSVCFFDWKVNSDCSLIINFVIVFVLSWVKHVISMQTSGWLPCDSILSAFDLFLFYQIAQ